MASFPNVRLLDCPADAGLFAVRSELAAAAGLLAARTSVIAFSELATPRAIATVHSVSSASAGNVPVEASTSADGSCA
jgi:hypothetical protein